MTDEVSQVGALNDETRRRLYEVVTAAGRLVGRDEAATEAGVDRSVAAYHLDRLTEAGLLEVEYRRLTGRQGPGAGRPAKLYRRAESEVQVSLPPRDYELVAELLASVVESVAPDTEVIGEVARSTGRRLGASASDEGVGDVEELLATRGYEPDSDPEAGERVLLRNCPFHHLAQAHRDLVCGMNQALIEGMLETAGPSEVEAVLDPAPGRCCVVLEPSPSPSPDG